jgi:hypothetical protein
MATPRTAADYFEMIRAEAKERPEPGQEDYEPLIAYYTPIGEEFRVAEMYLHEGTGTLQIMADDGHGNARDVYVSPQNAHIVLKLVPPTPGGRPPVGFNRK